MRFLDNIRRPQRSMTRSAAFGHTMLLFAAGLALGALSKLLDIYTSNLGNVFSQMSVWIFLCTLISVRSSTALRAGLNVFCFCAGMLLTYYLTAHLTNSVYSTTFIYGWTVFALCSPLMGFAAWYAKGTHVISRVLSIGILLVLLAAAVLMFDRIRLADVVFAALTGIVLFGQKRPKRKQNM